MHHESILSSWIYWIIFLCFFVLSNNGESKKKRKECEFFSFIIIFLFAVLRYDIGNDFMTYWIVGEEGNTTRNFELISGAIINFAHNWNFPPLIFIVFSTISLLGYRSVIRKESDNPSLSWYMYFTFPLFFFQDCSSVRQAGAMGMFFFAFSALQNKKYIHTVLLLIISILFHTSAAIGFLILLKPIIEKFDVKMSALLVLLSFAGGKVIEKIVMGYLGNTFLGDKFEYYLQSDNPGFNSMQYVLFGILILNLLFYKRLIKENPKNGLYIGLYTVGVLVYNAFSIEPITAIRFSTFFFMFEVLVIPSYKKILARYFRSGVTANGVIVIMLFALQLILICIYINAYNKGVLARPVYVPYQTWFNHI